MGGRASSASKDRWNAAHYDRIALSVPKGDREKIKAYAESAGLSLNAFIKLAIAEKMERDKNGE